MSDVLTVDETRERDLEELRWLARVNDRYLGAEGPQRPMERLCARGWAEYVKCKYFITDAGRSALNREETES